MVCQDKILATLLDIWVYDTEVKITCKDQILATLVDEWTNNSKKEKEKE